MIISSSRNFIFMKNIKMASSSVEQALVSCCDLTCDIISSDLHREGINDQVEIAQGPIVTISDHTGSYLLHKLGIVTDYEKYLKIALCRNPWDQQVSLFWYLASLTKRYKSLSLPEIEARYQSDFDEFITEKFGTEESRIAEARDAKDLLFILDGVIEPDIVLHFERLQEDFDTLCKTLGVETSTLPLLKSDTRLLSTPYQDYYNSTTQQLVGDTFEFSISKFGYRFKGNSLMAHRR